MAITVYKVRSNRDELLNCSLPYRRFLLVLFLAHAYSFCYYLAVFYIYVIKDYRNRRVRMYTDIFMYLAYFLFHVSWLVYGNVLVWSEEGQVCRDDESSEHVGVLVTVLICLGYIWFIVFSFITSSFLLFGLHTAASMRKCSRYCLKHMKGEALVGCFVKTRIHQVKYEQLSKCGICFQQYGPNDKCVEAICSKRHIFR